MGLAYGSIQEPEQLNKSRVGRETIERELDWFEAYGQVLLTFFEIASTAIPVVGPLVSAGFAAAQAGIITQEQVESGTVSPANLVATWGAVAFAGGSALSELAQGFSAASRIRTPVAQLTKDMAVAESGAFQRFESLNARMNSLYGASEAFAEGGSYVRFSNGQIFKPSNAKFGEIFDKLAERYMEISTQRTRLAAFADRRFVSSSELGNLNNLIGEIKGGYNFFNSQATRLQETMLFARAGEAVAEGTEEIREAQNKISNVLSASELDELLTILTEAGSGSIIGFRYRIRKFIKSLSTTKLKQLQEISQTLVKSSNVKRLFTKMANQPRGLAVLNASQLYQNEVQWIQNMNGSDMGRWAAEGIYHGLKTQIEAWAGGLRGSRLLRKIARKLEKGLNTATELEQAFIRSGGVVIASKYIWGLKIINRGKKTGYSKQKIGSKNQVKYAQHQVLVKFNKLTTRSKSGKNKDGKHDIIVYMTTRDIERLIAEGSSYWFSVGKKKGWFVSRGGRTRYGTEIKGWGALEISGQMSAMLSILPIQAIRSLGSIISNVKAARETVRGASGIGDWLNSYIGEVNKNFSNTGINRAGRLLSRGLVGTSLGRWAGAASQQFVTATINTIKSGGNTRSTWGEVYARNLKTVLGKRFISDTKSLTRMHTGRNVQALTTGRRLGISASVAGRGTSRSPGWFGGW